MEHNRHKEAFRQAIVCREHEKARRLWAQYIGCLRAECGRGALTQSKMDEARELFEWARVTLLCQRAHLQQRLRGLQVAGLYRQSAPAENRRRLQTSG
jgi:hypothetical protein